MTEDRVRFYGKTDYAAAYELELAEKNYKGLQTPAFWILSTLTSILRH